MIRLFMLACLCAGFLTTRVLANPEQVQAAHQSHVLHWMETLEKHPLVLIRANAARFLGDLQDRVAVPTLVRALQDSNQEVLLQAARALGKLGDATAIKPLYEMGSKYKGNDLERVARGSVEKIRSYLKFKRDQRKR